MEAIATTTSGRLRGLVDGQSLAFLGVPYAIASRFAPPEQHPRWDGVRDAVAHGASAPQPRQDAVLMPEPIVEGDNCLNLNVFTPDLGAANLPVLVWIHGGGFLTGGNASPWYRGVRFARDGVVLVSINYRLGVEGFLHVGDSGVNRGVLDWLAALTWVHVNIAAFGGDPGNVTVAGQSAGGIAAATLLAVPRARGLFRRAICMSAPAPYAVELARAEEVGAGVAADLGVASTRKALAGVPLDRLIAAQSAITPFGGEMSAPPDPTALAARLRDGLLSLGPVVDGDVVAEPPLDAIAAGAANGIDLLVGNTSEEACLLFTLTGANLDDDHVQGALVELGLAPEQAQAYRDDLPGSSPGAKLGQAFTDHAFRVATSRLADIHATTPAGTFAYEFRWRSPAMGGLLGAAHCLDLPFAFDNLDAEGVEPVLGEEPPDDLACDMHTAWVDFASSGDPGWARYDLDQRATMVFDTPSGVRHDPHRARREVWAGATQ